MKQHQAQQGKKAGVAVVVVVPPAGKQEAPITSTVASEKDGFVSETISDYRNLPNPHLF